MKTPEPINEARAALKLAALFMLAAFSLLSIFTLLVAGIMTFVSMKMPDLVSASDLWTLFITGVVSALCAVWLRYWLKNPKTKDVTINL